MASGIYAIKNLVTSRAYIGSTIRLSSRWNSHHRKLIASQHENPHLQRAWTKYGQENFEFVVLELIGDRNLLIEREQHWLDLYRVLGDVYNLCPCVEAPFKGCCHTEETKAKISVANGGNRHPFYGKHHTVESRRKIGAALIGIKRKPFSEEYRQKLSVANKGRHFTKEHIQKLSSSYPAFIDPNSVRYSAGNNLTEFCREHNLVRGGMWMVIHGKRKHHKKWSLA